MYQNQNFISITNKKAEELLAFLAWENGPVKKIKAAETLWPDSSIEKARDSLYKVCRYLSSLQKNDISIPFTQYREELYLDLSQVECDFLIFESLCKENNCIAQWEEAVKLYHGPFLFDHYYEWTEQAEAYYDIRYLELIQRLADYYQKQGNAKLVSFYKNKLL
ncbi:AfsR/SARP family transcriptional regulator [Anaeromicropila populeti]|uniref:DNA-binding transcriptional activator of the SARP family n=1 Tax=Anaeromicropila populeti TaxID=37658 RepID=A0A1I6IMZ0_9FIRM|nr:hypothetical protein [Anaeromicropila populeti]SFR68009.1 hypothetical protein SAMN05661086_00915 [Anaeromicropila populeti]